MGQALRDAASLAAWWKLAILACLRMRVAFVTSEKFGCSHASCWLKARRCWVSPLQRKCLVGVEDLKKKKSELEQPRC